ncbi:glycosyltransferase family 39 protein [Acidobacteria bacterium AH-259-O06]|nr:glycosyltransferase family 39 protein [Acidobacteria bacterium AH-259-O06]
MTEKTDPDSSDQPSLFENTCFILVTLWLVFVVRALFYISVTPLWEGFDEHAHFAYVQIISQQYRLPLNHREPVSEEIFVSLKSSPLPWEPRAFGIGHTHDEYWMLPESERNQLQQRLKNIPPAWGRLPTSGMGSHLEIYEAQQPPLYYFLMSVPYRLLKSYSLVERVFALRILSVLIASVLILPTFYLSKLVFESGKIALAVCGIMAFMPELMIDVCRIGNDSLSIALFSVLIVISVCSQMVTYRISLALGIILGLGLLTKAYFFTAIPAIAMVFLLRSRRHAESLGKATACFALVLLVAAAISGWWYVRNFILLGSPTGIMQSVALKDTSIVEMIARIPEVDWVNAVDTVFFSHIWFGNWSFLQVRSWMYKVFQYTFLLSVLGIVVSVLRRLLSDGSGDHSQGNVLYISFFYFWFWFGLLYHVLLTYLTSGVSATPGWYLYAVMLAEIVLLVYGLFSVAPLRLRRRILAILLALFSLLDLYGITFLLMPYYTGFIRHKPGGGLISFNPFNLSGSDYAELLSRLTVNKPIFMTTTYYVMMSGLFLLMSLSALVLCVKVFLQHSGTRRT